MKILVIAASHKVFRMWNEPFRDSGVLVHVKNVDESRGFPNGTLITTFGPVNDNMRELLVNCRIANGNKLTPIEPEYAMKVAVKYTISFYAEKQLQMSQRINDLKNDVLELMLDKDKAIRWAIVLCFACASVGIMIGGLLI